MGKKNKTAQRTAVASLQSAAESPAAEQAAIPVFSLSTAGLADYEIDGYPVFLVAVQEFQTANNNSRALADIWNRAYSLGRQDSEDDAWVKGHEQGYNKGQTAGFQLGMKAGMNRKDELASLVGHVGSYERHDSRSGRVDASVGTESSNHVSSAATQTDPITNGDTDAVTDYQSVGGVPETFDWANDASSIPIYHPPHHLTPRNVKALRTEGVTKPFSSLQRRAHAQRKQRKHQTITPGTTQRTPQRRTARANHRPYSQQSPTSSIPVFTVTYHVPPGDAKLDWDRDPRLIQLSVALRSLGWSPPP